MTRKSYAEQLEDLRQDVLDMGTNVHDRLLNAMEALVAVDEAAAVLMQRLLYLY